MNTFQKGKKGSGMLELGLDLQFVLYAEFCDTEREEEPQLLHDGEACGH